MKSLNVYLGVALLYTKQWIALKVRTDWLVKLRISFCYLPESEFASVTSEEIIHTNNFTGLWCILSHCFSIILKQVFTPVSVQASNGYLTRCFAAR